MNSKVKKTIIKVKEFDYYILFKIIFFLGMVALLIFSASGCVTLTDKDQNGFSREFDRHQPKEYRENG